MGKILLAVSALFATTTAPAATPSGTHVAPATWVYNACDHSVAHGRRFIACLGVRTRERPLIDRVGLPGNKVVLPLLNGQVLRIALRRKPKAVYLAGDGGILRWSTVGPVGKSANGALFFVARRASRNLVTVVPAGKGRPIRFLIAVNHKGYRAIGGLLGNGISSSLDRHFKFAERYPALSPKNARRLLEASRRLGETTRLRVGADHIAPMLSLRCTRSELAHGRCVSAALWVALAPNFKRAAIWTFAPATAQPVDSAGTPVNRVVTWITDERRLGTRGLQPQRIGKWGVSQLRRVPSRSPGTVLVAVRPIESECVVLHFWRFRVAR